MDEFRNDNLFNDENEPENDSVNEPSVESDYGENDNQSYAQSEYAADENRSDGISGSENIYSSENDGGSSNENSGYTNGYDYTRRNEQGDYTDRNVYSGGYSNPNAYGNNPYQQAPGSDGTYHYSYTNGGNQYQPPKKTKKSGTGKKIAAVILALVIVLASVGIGTVIGKKNALDSTGSGNSEAEKTTSDSAEVKIEGVANSTVSSESSPGVIVAEKARSSVVGVVVYDSTGALYGEGSGVVMGTGKSGKLTYIITCAHVISDKGVKSCGVLLEDGTVYDAKIVGYDERTDIGVISVEKTNLTAASFGDSSTLKVGETVYAIGNPGGSEYYGSVTDGIVSAVDRSITSTYTMEVIQHTAAISPGNSGGALVNSQGQVIGINSSKIADTDYEGMGFAVPIATAKPIVESIIEYGYVPNRPKLGISYASVTNYQLYSMVVQIKGLPKGSLIIANISDDSSLSGTKVQTGDMIVAVNGKDMTTSDVLLDVIDKSNVGDNLTLKICRINARTYEISSFEVTAKLVEDKGSSAKDEEETTSQSYYDYYYNNGKNNFEDFFNQFFGN